MTRISDKVKDIVDVHPFEHVMDFNADPGRTLMGYRFTDITADLMSKWITAITQVRRGSGAAHALAGYRGVGKSHLLATLSGILTRPELRSQISDALVRSTAESLSRRIYNVIFVQRGTGLTLVDEIKNAVSAVTGVFSGDLSDSLNELIAKALSGAGDAPTIIFVDTAPTRESRVSRDDGPVLSELALTARSLGIFVGVALDDDISGADGANASIVRSFAIDYLDQEHLYKIVDSHIFTKNQQKLGVLRSIYEDYRTHMPGFRWSERRFSSLYPLHPATLEIAPLIRLYVHDFALLSFASDAGVRILGRPANSLIGLDEMFDSVESRMRSMPLLQRGLTTYDKLDKEVVGAAPVLSRLYAKLILKGLFLFSLDGQGATAEDIAASMLISTDDERNGKFSVATVLRDLASTAGDEIRVAESAPGGERYSLRIEAGHGSAELLDNAIAEVDDATVDRILRSHTGEKFSDAAVLTEGESVTNCVIEWHGAIRRGRLIWNPIEDLQKEIGDVDWIMTVGESGGSADVDTIAATTKIHWKVAALSEDEIATVKRYHILHTDIALRDQVTEGLATALHSHTIALDKIWNRVYFEDATVEWNGVVSKFSDEHKAAFSLAQVFSGVLDPIFENHFPQHPIFPAVLGPRETATISAKFFGSDETPSADIATIVERFAVPLGIADVSPSGVTRQKGGSSLVESIVSKIAYGITGRGDEGVDIQQAQSLLAAAPYGLSREACQLVLVSMIADLGFEFVTRGGNRINSRSLDLQIVWDDIIGIAKPVDEKRSSVKLLEWARLLTKRDELTSLDADGGREFVEDALQTWVVDWQKLDVFGRFEAISDEHQTASIWKVASNVRRSFGAVADLIVSMEKDNNGVTVCLGKIAVLFSDSQDEYRSKLDDVSTLERYFANVERVATIETAMATLRPTGEPALESKRLSLLAAVTSRTNSLIGRSSDEITREWSSFTEEFRTFYFRTHEDAVGQGRVEFLRELSNSERWKAFESFFAIPEFERRFARNARRLIWNIRSANCNYSLNPNDNISLICKCGRSLVDLIGSLRSRNELRDLIGEGLMEARSILANEIGSEKNNVAELKASDLYKLRTSGIIHHGD